MGPNPHSLTRSGEPRQGLALRIVEGAVPPGLLGKRLVSLDLAALVAGSSFRGEFERRLKEAINLIAASQGQFLLLVDELHMIVGPAAARAAWTSATCSSRCWPAASCG